MTSGRQMWLEEHGDEPWDDRPSLGDVTFDDEPRPTLAQPVAEDPWRIAGSPGEAPF